MPAYFDEAFERMLRNFSAVLDSHCHLIHIDATTLENLLRSVALQAPPRTRLAAVLAWVSHDEPSRHHHIARLLSFLPGSLLGSDCLAALWDHPLVRNNCAARKVVGDMQKEHLPYYSTSDGVALGLKSLSDCGGCKVFRFVAGCAEFVATVEAGNGLSHVTVALRCERVAVSDGVSLPSSITASIAMRLCCEGDSGNLKEVHGGLVEEDEICLAASGCNERWVRRFNVSPHEMAHIVSSGKDCTLYVQVKEISINRYRCTCNDGPENYQFWDEKMYYELDVPAYMQASAPRHYRQRASHSSRNHDGCCSKHDRRRCVHCVVETRTAPRTKHRPRDSTAIVVPRKQCSSDRKKESTTTTTTTTLVVPRKQCSSGRKKESTTTTSTTTLAVPRKQCSSGRKKEPTTTRRRRSVQFSGSTLG